MLCKLTFFKTILEQFLPLLDNFERCYKQILHTVNPLKLSTMKKGSNSYDKMANKNSSEQRMRNLQNDTDLLLEENTEMMSVLNDLGELEDLTELYGNKDDII
jgi:hypothetical protein